MHSLLHEVLFPGCTGKLRKLSKGSYDESSKIAAVATASMGKFDRVSKGETKRKIPQRPDSKRAMSDPSFETKSTAKALSRVMRYIEYLSIYIYERY